MGSISVGEKKKVDELYKAIEELDINEADLSMVAGYNTRGALGSVISAGQTPPEPRTIAIAQALREGAKRLLESEISEGTRLSAVAAQAYMRATYFSNQLGVSQQALSNHGVPASRVSDVQNLVRKAAQRLLKVTEFAE